MPEIEKKIFHSSSFVVQQNARHFTYLSSVSENSYIFSLIGMIIFDPKGIANQFLWFSSDSGGEFQKKFRALAEEKSMKKPLTTQCLCELIVAEQYNYDWHGNKRVMANLRKILHNCPLPIAWSDEYRAAVAEHQQTGKQMDAQTLRYYTDRMKNPPKRKTPKKNPAPSRVVKVLASRGCDPRPSSSGGRTSPEEHGGAPAHEVFMDLAADAEDEEDDLLTVDASRFDPPVYIYAMLDRLDGIKFLAVPEDDVRMAEDFMGEAWIRYDEWIPKKVDLDNLDENDDRDQVTGFFQNDVGLRTLKFLAKKYTVKKDSITEELQQYLVSRKMLYNYMTVGGNTFLDLHVIPEVGNLLHEAREEFCSEGCRDTLKEAIEHKLQEIEAYEKAEKLKENRARLVKFQGTFLQHTTKAQMDARHVEYQALLREEIIHPGEYKNLLEQQARKIMANGGVTDNGVSKFIASNEDMRTKFAELNEYMETVQDDAIDAYLHVREDLIHFGKRVGDMEFHRQFIVEHGTNIKEYIQRSNIPELWEMFEKDFQQYERAVELEDLKKQLADIQRALAQRSAPAAAEAAPPSSGDGGAVGPEQSVIPDSQEQAELADPPGDGGAVDSDEDSSHDNEGSPLKRVNTEENTDPETTNTRPKRTRMQTMVLDPTTGQPKIPNGRDTPKRHGGRSRAHTPVPEGEPSPEF